MLRVAPKIVGIAGKCASLRFRQDADAPPPRVEIIELPSCLRASASSSATGETPRIIERATPWRDHDEYAIALTAAHPGRGVARVRIGGREFAIPAAIFRPREFFLCMVLSSNYHYGWDPLCYLFGGTPEQLDLEGDAWPKLRQLERMYHQRGIPVTWLIDEKVAAKAAESIRRWHIEHGDDYGVMPTSYIHHCAVNYNHTLSEDEAARFMRETLERTEAHFDWYPTVFAVDQFIGSIGSRFAEGAYRLGLEGLWGVGFDHRTCDTSMYHRGCPWDIYKPDRGNYRIPAGHPSRLWMFQWTTRDCWLSLHSPDSGPSGAVIFSTDPDDQRVSRILFEQPTYWRDFFRGYRENFPMAGEADSRPAAEETPLALNDVFCFLIHQEDHDCHFPENADLLRGFLDAVAGEATFATLDEVVAWLNCRYAPEEHPAQVMYVEDHLRCHSKVVWYAGVEKPADWPGEGETYPPGLVYYDAGMMWCANEGEALPWRFFDYRPRTPVAENEVYPETDLRREITCEGLTVTREGEARVVRAILHSSRAFPSVPLIAWRALDASCGMLPIRVPGGIAIREHLVVFPALEAGENAIAISVYCADPAVAKE